MSTAPVSICVISAPGLIGLRHTQHCLDEPSVVLACIVDPTPAGPVLSDKIGVPLFVSLDAMLAARLAGTVEVTGAILATPNATHVPLGIQLVEAGIHTLVEKPISTDIESGRKLVDAAAATSSRILVGNHRRFNPYIVNAKKTLVDGSLGSILAVPGAWTTLKPLAYFEEPTGWRKESAAGGPILINLVHDIDLMRYLFADITRVYCESGISTRGHPVEETGACTLRFASGCVGTFVFSDDTASPYNFESATGENPMMPSKNQNVYSVVGTGGSTSFPELKRWHYASPDGCWSDELQLDTGEPVDPTQPFTVQLRHFVEVCRGNAEPNCSGLEALKTIITLEVIKESMRTGLPVEVAQS